MKEKKVEYVYCREDLERCPKCEREFVNTRQRIKHEITGGLILILIILAVMGMIYGFMIWQRPDYFLLPFKAIQSTILTRSSYDKDPAILNVTEKILFYCENETDYMMNDYLNMFPSTDKLTEDFLKKIWMNNCKVEEAFVFMRNYTYIGDFAFGITDFSTNMIKENTTRGDCEDFSLTLCSMLNNMEVPCKIVTTYNHAMVLLLQNDVWVPYEPQTGQSGYFTQDVFNGWIV